jgi:hypothetical protein
MSDRTKPRMAFGDVDLFFGALSPAVARVYARWGEIERPDFSVLGTLTGPSCEYAATLPAVSQFVDRGPGGPPLAEAIVPEPSFWTPEMPHIYQAELKLLDGDQIVATDSRIFGLRPLGAASGRLRLDGRNYVLRGATMDEGNVGDLAAWHESNVAAVVKRPSDRLCEAASRWGVLLVAELERPNREEVRRLSRWPAVGLVILPTGCDFDPRSFPHNLLFMERLAGTSTPSAWADVVSHEALPGSEWKPLATSLPVVATRRPTAEALAGGRAACDRLQAELAHAGLLAGYIC